MADKWIWDFWPAVDGSDYHIFYLQAERTPTDPDARHRQVSIGHAVSQDLRNWEVLPDALHPDRKNEGAWDDLATWTGSIVPYDDLWCLFYTGGCKAENALVQRVGLATSTDLIKWERHPDNPVLTSDPRWYEQLDLEMWHDQAWRDPWVTKWSEDDEFHAYLCARTNSGPPDGRGVIAYATSTDLVDWTVHRPVTELGEFGHMEIPQAVRIERRYYLLFSTTAEVHSQERLNRPGAQAITGTYFLMSDRPNGPFDSSTETLLIGDPIGKLYGGKVLPGRKGEWVLLAMRHNDSDGNFVGELYDPMPLVIEPNGNIRMDA